MEKKSVIKIDESLDGKNVRSIIFGNLGLSKNIVTKLKQSDEGIVLNGNRTKVDAVVKIGDELVITIPDKKSEAVAKTELPLEILYEDEDIIAVNKPPFMPTHPSRHNKNKTLANALSYYFREKDFTFRVITRLDKDTSGVVLVAKNKLAAFELNEAMLYGKIFKEYVAVVSGELKEKGMIDEPIGRKAEGEVLRCVSSSGKRAVSFYGPLKFGNNLSYVCLKPITGRTHQLRVHMSHIGHPIYGDDMYGAEQKGERCRLHCRKIEFFHPISKKVCIIEAPVPEDINELVLKMG